MQNRNTTISEQFNKELEIEVVDKFKRYTQYSGDWNYPFFMWCNECKYLVENYSYVKKGQPILELHKKDVTVEKTDKNNPYFFENIYRNTTNTIVSKRDGYIYFYVKEYDYGFSLAPTERIIQENTPVYFITDDVEYIEKMKQIDRELAERMNKPVVKVEKKCYLYIMRDDYNGAYKIGIANNPKKRERTLQSDKPSITLHKCVEFKNREEASNAEKYLHSVFESQGWKRSDGKKSEWFKLGTNDLNWIFSKWNWKNVA